MEKTLHEKRENVRTIEAIRVFRNDVVVVRKRSMDRPGDMDTRGEITKWTSRAQKRLGFIAANTEVEFLTMITLTYPREFEKDGKAVKRHLNLFLKRFARRYDHSYLWFLEFQMRGAPHYHILTTRGDIVIDKLWVSEAWWEIVESQDRNHLLAGTRVEALRKTGAWYAVKYAYKMRQKEVPKNYRNVGRFYGYSRDVKPQPYMELSGNLDDIFQGCDGYMDLLESGYAVLFGLAGNVGQNAARGKAVMGDTMCENCDEREGRINSAIWVSIGEVKGHWVCWECEVDFIEEDERRKEESARTYSNRLVDRRNR